MVGLLTTLFALQVFSAGSEQLDTAQEKKQILYIGDNHLASAKVKILKASAEKHNLSLDAYSTRSFSKKPGLKAICDYPVVITQAVSRDAASGMYGPISGAMKTCASQGVKQQAIAVGFEMPHLNVGFSQQQNLKLSAFFSNGMRLNYENAFAYLGNIAFSRNNTVGDLINVPKVGVYHPDYKGLITADTKAFFKWKALSKSTSTVGVLIHRSAVENEQTAVVDATIRAIEKQGGKGVGIFFDGMDAHTGFRWKRLCSVLSR